MLTSRRRPFSWKLEGVTPESEAPAGSGASAAVNDPLDSVSSRPCGTPDTSVKPTATHCDADTQETQETPFRLTSE